MSPQNNNTIDITSEIIVYIGQYCSAISPRFPRFPRLNEPFLHSDWISLLKNFIATFHSSCLQAH